MSKVLELVERIENELSVSENKTLEKMYGTQSSIKIAITLTKIIRLQHSALINANSVMRKNTPKELSTTAFIQIIIQETLAETNRIAGGE